MKFKLIALFLILSFSINGQNLAACNKKLKETFSKFEYYGSSENEHAYDSIQKYNISFENLLLKYTSSIPETLTFDFKDLTQSGLKISTSENSLFRIYSWDTETGGSMRSFRNVFQFNSVKKLFSLKTPNDLDESGESSYTYEIIDQINSENKMFYVVKCIAIGSSAVSSHKIKIFSIQNGLLDDKAKLIKTKSGIRNELRYEIDFSSSANQTPDAVDREYSRISYDKNNKIIMLPLILEDGKLTKKKIKYQFNGIYFEKI